MLCLVCIILCKPELETAFSIPFSKIYKMPQQNMFSA